MLTNLLSTVKEKFTSQRDTIEGKIKELENKKSSLQNALEVEFDRQVQAELSGETYDEGRIKKLNTELLEIDGRIAAYRRQLSKHSITAQDRESMMEEAANEYRGIAIENLKRIIKRYELDLKIRALIKEAESLNNLEDNSIYSQLNYSGLFPGMDEHALRNEVIEKADITNDEEYKKLNEKLKAYNEDRSIYHRFIWQVLERR